MKARHKRMGFLAAGLVLLVIAAVLIFKALGTNLSYFYTPSEVAQGKAPENRTFRLGGLVKAGSLERGKALTVSFVVTDEKQDTRVEYTGILPDLFAEGQGVIAQGKLAGGDMFVAETVLAKHDENYMPPEVAEALARGHEDGVKNMKQAVN